MSILLNNIDGTPNYTLGDTVELILKVDQQLISTIGDTINLQVVDIFDNVIIPNLTGVRLNDIYVAEFSIPLNIATYYNINKVDESQYDSRLFYLKDEWTVGVNAKLSFDFTVSKTLESATEDNCIIEIFLDGICSADGSSTLNKSMVMFGTKFTPYYCSVIDVKDLYRDLLSSYDDFIVARHIINVSSIIDSHMKPDTIYRPETYNSAIRNFTKYKVAQQLLLSVIQTNEEEKWIDTFRYRKSTASPQAVLDKLESEANKYALVIWAGGNDTPFISKTFTKGLFDPNRPSVSRSRLDTRGWFPWVNTTSASTVVNINGNNSEIRGERIITYSYVMNRYSNSDNGDAGQLSHI